ncbi:type III secretion system stator protein SctL [Burkholderia singularis]|uniref:Type 3 secretion system stator protein n=1 Tax=Burkholderia singularis TaxID=1503053 RepID=A0A238H3S3_9BURK|nr:type III secretion system stator protein SctL [Burkholderia singularis]SMF99966.1 Type III secretion inner membrane protein SctL [Burkholderia singularis]
MVIWLRRNGSATAQIGADAINNDLGVTGDVIARDTFGKLVELEQAYAILADQREALLADAHAQAASIVAAAEDKAQQLLDAARRDCESAIAQGYADGYDQARTEWMEQVAASADMQTKMQKRMCARLAEIVTSAVEQIVHVQNHDALFERALSTVERMVDGATYLHVAVNPQDFEQARTTFNRLASRWRELGYPISLSVNIDKRLAPGSCVCDSDCGTVDASLDTQLRAMRNAVSRALKRAVDRTASATMADETSDPGLHVWQSADAFISATDISGSQMIEQPHADDGAFA